MKTFPIQPKILPAEVSPLMLELKHVQLQAHRGSPTRRTGLALHRNVPIWRQQKKELRPFASDVQALAADPNLNKHLPHTRGYKVHWHLVPLANPTMVIKVGLVQVSVWVLVQNDA
jgi:hypothetical protein